MGNNKNLHGHLFALTANVMWGLMSPIGKSALQEFSAISVTTFRMVGAAAAFWILSIFCKQEHVDHRDMLKDFLRFPLCSGFQSGGIYLRAFDDFAYRCFYRNDYSADSYHDCGSYLSERTDYE